MFEEAKATSGQAKAGAFRPSRAGTALEDRSTTRDTTPPPGATHLSGPSLKRARDKVEDFLDRVSRGELVDDDDGEQRVVRRRTQEDKMPWFDPAVSSARRSSCVDTCRTLLQFSEDPAGVRALLRVANNLPEGIPSSQ